MTNTSLLREKIKKSGLKMEFIAEKLGLSRAAFSMKVNNESAFKVPEMYKLCDLLDIDEEYAKDIFFAN